ncbi:MAG: hypothetical protein ACRD5F_14730 [Candidatus Acidiferrales bacterium]
MNRSSLFALVALAAAFTLAAVPARAQSGPIVVKQPKVRTQKFKGQVIHANRLQITVRSAENDRVIRTFELSSELQEKMRENIDRGHGYQNGDKVEVHYAEGSDVAVKIKGKPSKPK